jgi:hypothetical protein
MTYMLVGQYHLYMIHDCIDQVKGFLMKPGETFKQTKEKSIGCAYQYYVGLLIFFSILFTIVSVALGIAHFNAVIAQAASIPFIGKVLSEGLSQFTGFVALWRLFAAFTLFLWLLIAVFINGLILHAFVLLVGGEKGWVQTVKTTMYAYTPALLLGWIPYIWIIGIIWAIVLFIIGISKTQEISIGKGFLVIIVPIILTLIWIGLGAAVIISFIDAMVKVIPKPF